MKGIFSPVDNVREPPVPPRGEDIHEPPLPANDGSKDDLPGEDEKIDPEEGGGKVPQRLSITGGDSGTLLGRAAAASPRET